MARKAPSLWLKVLRSGARAALALLTTSFEACPLWVKADICSANSDVRFGPIADMIASITMFALLAKESKAQPLSVSLWFSEIKHNAPKARSYVLLGEPEFGAHLQHSRVFDQHIAIHAPQTLFFGVVDDALHQEPAKPVTFEPRADQDRKFRGFFVELLLQAHEPEHASCGFVKRDESHFVLIVEMAEFIDLLGTELGDARKKTKSQILGANIG